MPDSSAPHLPPEVDEHDEHVADPERRYSRPAAAIFILAGTFVGGLGAIDLFTASVPSSQLGWLPLRDRRDHDAGGGVRRGRPRLRLEWDGQEQPWELTGR